MLGGIWTGKEGAPKPGGRLVLPGEAGAGKPDGSSARWLIKLPLGKSAGKASRKLSCRMPYCLASPCIAPIRSALVHDLFCLGFTSGVLLTRPDSSVRLSPQTSCNVAGLMNMCHDCLRCHPSADTSTAAMKHCHHCALQQRDSQPAHMQQQQQQQQQTSGLSSSCGAA